MSRTQYVENAKKSMESGDPDAAVRDISTLAQYGALSAEERGLLYAAFKAATGKRRAEIAQGANPNAKRELAQFAAQAIEVFGQALSSAPDSESKVFYYKALGDFYRYYDEAQPAVQNKEQALQNYKVATDWAAALAPTNPLRLNVALNFGVYYQETTGNARQGLQITTDAIDAARTVLPSLTDEREKLEASFVLTLLMDNARLWSSELGIAEPRPIQGLATPPPPPQGAPPAQGGAPPRPAGRAMPRANRVTPRPALEVLRATPSLRTPASNPQVAMGPLRGTAHQLGRAMVPPQVKATGPPQVRATVPRALRKAMPRRGMERRPLKATGSLVPQDMALRVMAHRPLRATDRRVERATLGRATDRLVQVERAIPGRATDRLVLPLGIRHTAEQYLTADG